MANRNAGSNARKSRAQHELAGTFRKASHADLKNPEPTTGRPEPPAEFDKVGQTEWDRMMWAFDDMGMLYRVDDFAVAQYCKLFVETERVAEQQSEAQAGLRILEENLAFHPETPDSERLSPADKVQLFAQIVTLHKIISKCTDQLRSGRMAIRQYLVEFGLTPASRGRIKLPAKAEPVDEFSAFQKKRGVA